MNNISRILPIGLAVAFSTAMHAQTPPPAATPAPAAPAAVPAPTTPPVAAAPSSTKSERMQGLAAVYSDKLDGRKTASGQVFRQQKLTAAHPTLPFGTKVKVTNTKNNKNVEVTINDRGPTQPDRVIDLSSAAAAKISIGKKAMAPVTLEVVGEPPARK